jgi:hypothetical protein
MLVSSDMEICRGESFDADDDDASRDLGWAVAGRADALLRRNAWLSVCMFAWLSVCTFELSVGGLCGVFRVFSGRSEGDEYDQQYSVGECIISEVSAGETSTLKAISSSASSWKASFSLGAICPRGYVTS